MATNKIIGLRLNPRQLEVLDSLVRAVNEELREARPETAQAVTLTVQDALRIALVEAVTRRGLGGDEEPSEYGEPTKKTYDSPNVRASRERLRGVRR